MGLAAGCCSPAKLLPPAASGRNGPGLWGGAAASGLPGGRSVDQGRPQQPPGPADQPGAADAQLVGEPGPAAPG